MRKLWVYLQMFVGTTCLTAGVYFFKIPNGFATGGVSGIGTILGTALPLFSPAAWISGVNLLMLLFGFIFLGRSTGTRTVICSLLFSGMTWVAEQLIPIEGTLTDQPFLELTYAILLTGIGSALLFSCNASSGGTDIAALILKKYTQIDVGKALLCVDSIVAVSSFFVFGISTGLFSVLGLFMKAFLVDSVIESIKSAKCFTVITKHPEEISQYIMQQLHRGATASKVMGEYTGEERTMIYTVCSRIQAVRLRAYISQVDTHAFVIVTTANEIIGRGFRGV